MALVLGVDCGTQSLRAVLADLAGNVVASAAKEFPISYPRVSWAEQWPEDWWEAAKQAVPERLVHSVMPSHVLAKDDQFSMAVIQSCGVHASGVLM